MADETEEPVAYLGGESGEAPPPAEPAPSDGEEVDGYLGGEAAPADPNPDSAVDENLPALGGVTGSYSAKDFLPADSQEAPADDPYADPYANQQPAEGYGDYEGYDSAAVEQPAEDPAYFESMAHGTSTEAPPAEEYAGDDPDQPKTISQQDAESIIRRITTKRILPPDSGAEKKVVAPPPPKLTEVGGGTRLWPVLLVILIIGVMALGFFGEQIRDMVPEEYHAAFFWLEPKQKVVIDIQRPVDDPNEVAKKKLLDTVLLSEAKAFGVATKDVPAAPAVAKPRVDTPTESSPPGGSTGTSGGGQ